MSNQSERFDETPEDSFGPERRPGLSGSAHHFLLIAAQPDFAVPLHLERAVGDIAPRRAGLTDGDAAAILQFLRNNQLNLIAQGFKENPTLLNRHPFERERQAVRLYPTQDKSQCTRIEREQTF